MQPENKQQTVGASQIESIIHTEVPLANGGFVLILNTGATIGPESEAMLQALHSRSIGGIKSHLKVLAAKGAENFMANFYVGYGHKSIGDCGSCTIFIEGVSLLVAKAIQDTPLYSGQEASTRYIDFAKQAFIDPVASTESREILETWRAFYLRGLEILQEDLKKRYPRGETEDEKIYLKAIKARAFDIMRGFLPSGASTNLAWHTNFRQAADHLMRLRHHPLAEVRETADAIETGLKKAYPSSFGHPRFETTENFNERFMKEAYYFEKTAAHSGEKNSTSGDSDFSLTSNTVDRTALETYSSILKTRFAKTEVPREIGECGTLQFEFMLDFGSFRDLHRHRAIIQRMPLVTMNHGFEEWYLNELPADFRTEAVAFIAAQKEKIEAFAGEKMTKEIAQYYIPMGYRLPNKITGPLPALIYLAELRATRFVHSTLRKRAIQIANTIASEFKNEGVVIHLDSDPDRFDIKRGEHDIVQK
jgi:thymidylate synthase ThyX